MAYADQQMSGNRIVAIIIVALIHVGIGYALITGLAYSAVKKAIERVTTVDIEEPEEKPEEEPPPPEPDQAPPPIVAPPPPISISITPPQVQTVQTPPPPAPVVQIARPAPAPPAPRVQPKNPQPRGNPANWATTDDYPSRALREEREGVTRFRVSVDSRGRVTSCDVTGSSGSPDLDEAACRAITRRARFEPATDGNGDPTSGTYSNAVRWQIPK